MFLGSWIRLDLYIIILNGVIIIIHIEYPQKKDMSAFEEELGQIDWQSLLFSENLETAHRIFIELKNVRNKYTKLKV